eukprot:scaffold135860_cov21-Tisochrysis_lutea.AAC.2
MMRRQRQSEGRRQCRGRARYPVAAASAAGSSPDGLAAASATDSASQVDLYDAALRKALGLQAKRVYTTAEMATKLRQREIPEAIIDKVLARLTALVGVAGFKGYRIWGKKGLQSK